MPPLGRQVLADLYACDRGVLADAAAIEGHMLEAARRAGARVVATEFHRFSPHGVSGVVVIAESHLAIHTWPEHGFAALDLFTCGESLRVEPCFDYLVDALGCQHHTRTAISRGGAPPNP